MIEPPTVSPPLQHIRRWPIALLAAGAMLLAAALSLSASNGYHGSPSELIVGATKDSAPAAAKNTSLREQRIQAAFKKIEWSTTNRRYNDTWEHHSRAFYTTDLEEIIKDYAEEAVLVVYNYATGGYAEFSGHREIQRLYAGIFPRLRPLGPDGTIFSGGFSFHARNTPRLRDNTVFFSWQSYTPAYTYEWATDTYIMRESDGKFIHQSVYYHGLEGNATDRRV